MARLYEYQGKQLLREVGVPVPQGDVASTPEEAKGIAAEMGKPVAIKAQIWATGRFKAGGIRFANHPEEAERVAGELLGSEIKGFRVDKVLVEEKLEIEKEYYAGVIVSDSRKVRAPVVMFSTEGGVDIEEVVQRSPEKIARVTVDIRHGLRAFHAYNLVLALGLSGELLAPISQAICGLYALFRRYDARSAEINPLVLTRDGRVCAADCRVSIDDASVARHPELGITVPRESDRPPTELDRLAWKIEEDDYRGVSFFAQLVPHIEAAAIARSGFCDEAIPRVHRRRLLRQKTPRNDTAEGYIGYHAIGGGGALLAADTLARRGLKLANYAETSGNPPASKVYRCAKVILSQPGIEGYCLMGAVIASQDQWHHAHGLVKAFREDLADRPGFPVVILLAGNKEAEALEILREGLKDLPIRLELYGRDYIHRLDFVAQRMKALVEEYREASKPCEGCGPSQGLQGGYHFESRTGRVSIDHGKCAGCTTFACVKACSLYGSGILRVEGGKPVLSIPPRNSIGTPQEETRRRCIECLACEIDCHFQGQQAVTISLPIAGLEEFRRTAHGHPAG